MSSSIVTLQRLQSDFGDAMCFKYVGSTSLFHYGPFFSHSVLH